MNWNDLKYLIAVHREGTLSAASKALNVNQTTVSRRLQSLETYLKAPLFQRTNGSLLLTQEGLNILPLAEDAEAAFLKLEKQASIPQHIQGPLKITSIDSLINEILLPALPSLLKTHPNLEVNLHGASNNLEISKFEADIGIRLARPDSGTMIVSKLSNIGLAIYGTKEMEQKAKTVGLDKLPWAKYDDQLSQLPEMQWLDASYPSIRPSVKSYSASTLSNVIARGIAVGILPCFLGDSLPTLKRLSGPHPIIDREVWLVMHSDANRTPRVKAGVEWVRATFRAGENRLKGEGFRGSP
ncbi:MAG: LysR family transcriptional regulator [Sneathiella sp.]